MPTKFVQTNKEKLMVSKKEGDKESKEPEIDENENENEGQLEEDHISKVKKKRKNQLATTKAQS